MVHNNVRVWTTIPLTTVPVYGTSYTSKSHVEARTCVICSRRSLQKTGADSVDGRMDYKSYVLHVQCMCYGYSQSRILIDHEFTASEPIWILNPQQWIYIMFTFISWLQYKHAMTYYMHVHVSIADHLYTMQFINWTDTMGTLATIVQRILIHPQPFVHHLSPPIQTLYTAMQSGYWWNTG